MRFCLDVDRTIMRDYGKVHTSFWSSATIRAMSEDARALALYLLTSPHSTIAGVFRLPDGYVCEDLQWTSARVNKGFAELLSKGYANRCETTKWVWICKHLEWNPPENPNQRKSAAKVALSTPDECVWKLDFMRVCGRLIGISDSENWNPSETLPEPFPNQEQEQEQEQENMNTSPAKLPTCPVDKIIESYEAILPELPQVRVIDKEREKLVRDRWKWVLTSTKPDGTRRAETSEQATAWFDSYFERARDNDFLMGRTPKVNGHAGWQCDIDFLMTTKGLKQVIEKTGATA